MSYSPDYNNLISVARNIEVKRIPLYEHIIAPERMECIVGTKFDELSKGSFSDKKEFFRHHTSFFKNHGYDTASYECCVGPAMPGSGLLAGHGIPPAISDMDDFKHYPWDEIPDYFFNKYDDHYKALSAVIPTGMKFVGGIGNGVFEIAQDLCGFENLCYILSDDPLLFSMLFKNIGEVMCKIWDRFLKLYGDSFCVCRFGDDLGYKSNTMLPANIIKEHIIPIYKNVIDIVHSYKKPFLLHSCGCIFDVMDDIINIAKIDAKHSNEDAIAPFPVWVERYGDKIGNFGGIDTDAVCRLSYDEMKEYITEVVTKCKGHGGFAFGSGNSIPSYVPVEGFLNMNRIIRELRGE